MSGKQIRIIRRVERDLSQARDSDKKRPVVRNSPEKTKHEAAAIVTGWVSELRRRKAEELAQGFESLFRQGDVKVA